MRRLFGWLFTRRITLYRWQFSLFGLLVFICGLGTGVYLTVTEVILPHVFAATSPWTQTDWSGGSGASTTNQYSDISAVDATTTSGQLSLSTNSGWYDSSWKYRRKITFDNTTATLGVTSEALTNFPVLVKLTSSNIDYANTQDAGQDVRFADSDGTTLLSYEIEKWDEAGSSYVWVKVPSIDINSNTDFIYVYYGNTGASDAQAATSVWDSSYKGVWHLGDSGPTTATDSTSNAKNGTQSGGVTFGATGQINSATSFDGSNDSITVPTLSVTSDITVSTWVYSTNFDQSGMLVMKKPVNQQWELFLETADSVAQGIKWRGASTAEGCATASFPSNNEWHHIQVTQAGTTCKIYLDGVLIKTATITAIANGTTSGTNDILMSTLDGSAYPFNGTMDEVRISNVARSAAWIAASYISDTDTFNTFSSQEGRYVTSGTLTSNIFDTEQASAWGTLTYASSGSTVAVKARSSDSLTMVGATVFSSCSAITSGTDISSNDCMTDGHRYVQYQVALSTADAAATPTFSDISISFSAYDTVAPTTNASSIAMAITSGGRAVASGDYNNATTPYFSWTAGADDEGGSGLKGYCLYLGTSSSGNPATSGGLLQNSPVSTSGSTCGFIVSGASVDLSAGSYLSSALADGSTYYLNVKAIDNANNLFATSATFNFLHDETAPTNVAYVSTPSSNFGNVVDMNFSWPTSGSSAASDATAGVLGYQYQLNGTGGTWLGTSTSSECGLDYIPAVTASYTFTEDQDAANVSTGDNVIYFRAVDTACNISTVATYRTGNISYGGAAPSFTATCAASNGVTVTPTTSTGNSFALSWSAAAAADGQSVTNYYYMVNTSPPSALSTITSSSTTYLDNATTTSVAAGALTGSVRGTNTVYVVAVDDADNYSSSNCIKGTYTLNSTNPDPPLNLAASDASIKSSSLWRASLGWDVPAYKGTGSLTYKIQRSTDNSAWTDVTTTTGTSYIDTVSESKQYYWRVGSYDTSSQSQADISWATSVTLTPKGTFTTAADLSSGPTASGITTKKATISWSTSRVSDSKISYGTATGDYFSEEPSKAAQVTSHEIQLTNLTPGTAYYYRAKWTDEDGNTGTSDEKTLTTEPAPTVSSVTESNVTISSALIKFTVDNASQATLSYGKTTSYGGTTEVSTSSSEASYTVQLSDLEDDTEYHYQLTLEDSEGGEYEFEDHVFTTVPRPRISNVQLQEVAGTAQPTVRVAWESNTAISSIVTYYPAGSPSTARDQVDVAQLAGDHTMIITGLIPNTNYNLIVKGVDTIGNETQSEVQTFTTATDTRPPRINNLKVDGTIPRNDANDPTAQLIVSWDTDEAATSQVEFAEGTGSTYTQATQEDGSPTLNHLVLISGLTPAKVYHLRAISRDSIGNSGLSVDTVTITPKATASAWDLVVSNLSEVFGFLRGLGR